MIAASATVRAGFLIDLSIGFGESVRTALVAARCVCGRYAFNNGGRRSERIDAGSSRRCSEQRLGWAREQMLEQQLRTSLGQGFVEVAALGRLHARGTAARA